ncbi:hypothetical protein [Neptuniibacter pectenicola]
MFHKSDVVTTTLSNVFSHIT